MKDIIFILGILPFPCLMLYVLFSGLVGLIRQRSADDMRKAYQACKTACKSEQVSGVISVQI